MALPGNAPNATVVGMFDDFPIGRTTTVAVSNGFWTGGYGGVVDGTALLTNAQLYDNAGTAVGVLQLETRIAFNMITYVV